ncbi:MULTISPECIES: phosphopantetheine-binding protein [Thermomonosporaceae]|uniref:phosphopantetheine-binding protein n=1 Tax=Thermomonosporaceae TaxID=2012 RepID=UPI00255AEF80|nr:MULTISPECIES: phosphopantetheine-binding protein [Thermomonosporaceae]MDL4770556.1 phosphopantetheine-binding protein [Actinomadura xylanilytica]
MHQTRDELRSDVAGLLDLDPAELGFEDDLIDAGLDSIRVMMLIERWRDRGAEIGFAELAETPTLAGWHALLSGGGR